MIINISTPPPFPWVGGKTALIPQILCRMPPQLDRYVEPFGGGGAVLFFERHAPFEIYNDYNSQLTNLMWQIKNNHEYFLNLLLKCYDNTNRPNHIQDRINRLFISARDNFRVNDIVFRSGGEIEKAFSQIKRLINKAFSPREIRNVMGLINKMLQRIKQREQDPDVWDAVLFYEILKTSYGSTGRSWCNSSTNSSNFENLIVMAHNRLESVGIENKDFRDIIQQYDRINTFFYCDPPYFETENYYENIGEFGAQEHIDLHDAALKMQGKFLISYNGCDFIENLYAEDKFHIAKIFRAHNLRQRYEKGALFPELLISNYDTSQYNYYRQLSIYDTLKI
jgi:DNA adenine methylase